MLAPSPQLYVQPTVSTYISWS